MAVSALVFPFQPRRQLMRVLPRLRQIPYAIGQFTVNELCHEVAFRSMSKETRANLSPTGRFSIMLGSGIIAGFAAAILSQPADTLLSQRTKGQGPKGFRTTPSPRRSSKADWVQGRVCRSWSTYGDDGGPCVWPILAI